MHVRIGINGMGRIGRAVLRSVVQRPDSPVEVVAVNDIAPVATLAHLLRYDSTYGRWDVPIETDDDHLTVDGHLVRVLDHSRPEDVDWRALGVDVVVEATGRFRIRERVGAHLAHGGARKVVLTAPGEVDVTVVLGVNDDEYSPHDHHIVSNASCTTNCAAPMVDVLHRSFGVRHGLLTTVHSYTGDQNLIDGPHRDLRRARSAATNIVPTSTGAARAITTIIPELDGRLDGVAVRVPVADVSLVDLTVQLAEPATVGQVNRAFATAAEGHLKGILRYTSDPIVSRDVLGDPASCVLDSGLTTVTGDLVKVFGWYDNEWGYAQRTVDLVEMVARTLPGR
ncbi:MULTISPECIES: type I glyceraldehyde-3-phosphate dehydrogenase [unclassified Pseudonocardia]|jgi:glyceraldehyde 3-phosphate dehydrogenase|uniref:type I glyceraldehyde-3-phosphate dehydrogenase n=1 Tax=unclassified Pseudonocardia TaxID=2619320 RepID=UPI000968BCF9|nr:MULTISPECIES: type I glyceraldehyde-3-phosphate dehydrogenase [unclassified Pseudonocardia]MBN9099886.1 type I glyceraldehyde-3-phosphate dehydrogenase [Pseudonocardia sp.]OJY43965.1 MAG: type I glyceraldehyde-3-phosphate dehydrogenase [Pseudonocardia sp. 73-21]